MQWSVYFTKEAEETLLRIEDRRMRKLIKSRALRLGTSPDMQGKPLGGKLTGVRSVLAAGQRYRIIYELFAETGEVWVVTSGIAKQVVERMCANWQNIRVKPSGPRMGAHHV